jgi:type VI protein secretion system component Hcp
MDFEGIAGGTTVKSGGTVEVDGVMALTSFNWSCGRDVEMVVGTVANRAKGHPLFSEVTVTKGGDQATPLLFQSCATETAGKSVNFYFQKDDDIWVEYNLQQAFVSGYSITVQDTGDKTVATERVDISYIHVVKKFKPYDEQGNEQGPQPAGYNLEEAVKV